MIPTSIFKMFGHSPISPLQKHMAKSHECTERLLPFFVAVLNANWGQAQQCQQEISTLEKEADDLKRDIRMHLPKSIFMPVDRSDVLELLVAQDRVANKAKDIAGLILGRKMQFPEEIAQQIINLLQRSIAASTQAATAINELSALLESGFRGNEIDIVKEMIHKLDLIENETDDIQKTIRHDLFSLEKNLPPINVMFLYKIIEWIGDLADRAQHVGGKLQILLAR